MITQVSAVSKACVILSEGQGHSNWTQTVEFSYVSHHTKLVRNQFTSSQTLANAGSVSHEIT